MRLSTRKISVELTGTYLVISDRPWVPREKVREGMKIRPTPSTSPCNL